MCEKFDPRFAFCSQVGTSVRICRPEDECRSDYRCAKPNCPLHTSFGMEAFDERMKEFATEFDLWPVQMFPEISKS